MRPVVKKALWMLLCAIAGAGPAPAQSETSAGAGEVLEQIDAILYPQSFSMRIEIETRDPPRPKTSLEMEMYHRRGSGTYIEIIAPRRLAGTRMLTKGDSVRMYNPRSMADRAIELSGRRSFQGTLLSNSDVSGAGYAERYTAAFGEEQTIEHPALGVVECRLIRATASAEDAAYGKMEVYVRKKPMIPVRIDFYSRSGLLFKRMHLSEFQEIAGMVRPTVMRVKSMTEEKSYTVLRTLSMKIRATFPSGMFTRGYLTEEKSDGAS